jgi:hypothetical protein
MRNEFTKSNSTSVFQSYLLQNEFSRDVGGSTIDDADGSYIVPSSDSNFYLLDGSPDLAHAFLTSVMDDDARDVYSALYDPVTCIMDSGSNTHVFTLETAQRFFTSQQISTLELLGVSGRAVPADLQGHLVVVVEAPNGQRFELDLGLAHGMKSIPVMNLLSVSLLIKKKCCSFSRWFVIFSVSKRWSPHPPSHKGRSI